ncbi:YchJ family protein [Corynebacterium sp. TAE3-ERU2]|uniref:YchJ family protein n=1 Tax=Corynebacterium sp. TAE3-ERU2 TaxID=2849497 RepID=UPI00351D4816
MTNMPGHILDGDTRCPCCSGQSYGECCGIYHGISCSWDVTCAPPAPTAEATMRARYTAFAVGHGDYLLATWAPEDSPARLSLNGESMKLYRLDILETTQGGPMDDVGTVSFAAYHRGPNGPFIQRERSLFRRRAGLWLYTKKIPLTC